MIKILKQNIDNGLQDELIDALSNGHLGVTYDTAEESLENAETLKIFNDYAEFTENAKEYELIISSSLDYSSQQYLFRTCSFNIKVMNYDDLRNCINAYLRYGELMNQGKAAIIQNALALKGNDETTYDIFCLAKF